jgi:hypothetical protein
MMCTLTFLQYTRGETAQLDELLLLQFSNDFLSLFFRHDVSGRLRPHFDAHHAGQYAADRC